MNSKNTKHLRKYNRSISAYKQERSLCAGFLRIIGALLLLLGSLLVTISILKNGLGGLVTLLPALVVMIMGALFIAACWVVEAFFDIADCQLRNAYKEFYVDKVSK